MAESTTEAALVQALITNTPEALLRLLTSSSTAEPDAAAAALVEALGKQDALAKALAATTAARRAVAADRAETAAGCFDGRFRSEVGRALERLAEGESCCIEKIQDEDAREALEHVLRGLGLRPAPRDELAGAPGFAADDACSRRACAALAASMRPVAAAPVAAEAPLRRRPRARRGARAGGGRARAAGPRRAAAPRAPAPRPPPESSSSSDDDGPRPRRRRAARAAAADEACESRRGQARRLDARGRRDQGRLRREKRGLDAHAADGRRLTALTKDGLPAAKSRLGSGRGALPQPTAAEVAADEERRRAARAARGPALVETFQAKKSTAPAQKPAKWTRDAMDAPQRMDAKAARAVIEKAKGLDSRFSSSAGGKDAMLAYTGEDATPPPPHSRGPRRWRRLVVPWERRARRTTGRALRARSKTIPDASRA